MVLLKFIDQPEAVLESWCLQGHRRRQHHPLQSPPPVPRFKFRANGEMRAVFYYFLIHIEDVIWGTPLDHGDEGGSQPLEPIHPLQLSNQSNNSSATSLSLLDLDLDELAWITKSAPPLPSCKPTLTTTLTHSVENIRSQDAAQQSHSENYSLVDIDAISTNFPTHNDSIGQIIINQSVFLPLQSLEPSIQPDENSLSEHSSSNHSDRILEESQLPIESDSPVPSEDEADGDTPTQKLTVLTENLSLYQKNHKADAVGSFSQKSDVVESLSQKATSPSAILDDATPLVDSAPLINATSSISATADTLPEAPETVTRSSSKSFADLPDLDFDDFLNLMRHPSNNPVTRYLCSFLKEFTKRKWTPSESTKIVLDFINFVVPKMLETGLWSVDDEEKVREGMEKLVTSKLYSLLFCPALSDDRQRDDVAMRKMQLFQWVEESHLDISPILRSRSFLHLAIDGLCWWW